MTRNAAGRDFQSLVMGGASNGTGTSAPMKYMALSADAGAPSDSATTLTGEITTGGGGLIRKAATYGHTPGASNYTQTAVFTANGSDALPVTVAKMAMFNAAAAGTMGFESLLTPGTATLNAVGDQLTVTDTVSI